MTDHQPRHVFISYVRENKEQVDRLCQDLETHGVKVWLDRNDIKPGARWKDAIPLRDSDYTRLVTNALIQLWLSLPTRMIGLLSHLSG